MRPFFFRISTGVLAALIVGVLAARSGAALGISPAYVDVRLDKERVSGEFIVTNAGDAEERYRIQSLHFNMSRTGALDRLDPDENSLASWIIFNPKEFTLPPKSKRTIRFAITPKGNLRPGEYWAGMELESLNTSVAAGKDLAGHEMKIQVISTILVPIFGMVGDADYRGTVKETTLLARPGFAAIQTLLVNEGNARLLIGGEFEVAGADGQTVDKGQLPRVYVFRGGERLFEVPLKKDLPEGKYTVKVRLTSPQLEKDKVLSDEATVAYKPAPPPPPTTQPTTRPATAGGPPSAPAPSAAPAPPDLPAAAGTSTPTLTPVAPAPPPVAPKAPLALPPAGASASPTPGRAATTQPSGGSAAGAHA